MPGVTQRRVLRCRVADPLKEALTALADALAKRPVEEILVHPQWPSEATPRSFPTRAAAAAEREKLQGEARPGQRKSSQASVLIAGRGA
jgi:hypothetical protein